MARTKSNDKAERLPTLQIPVSKELKADVEHLALSYGYRQVSEFLLPMIQQLVEVNQERLNRYREFISAGAMPTFKVSEPVKVETPPVKSKSKAKSSKKETKAKETPADESAGVDNAENV